MKRRVSYSTVRKMLILSVLLSVLLGCVAVGRLLLIYCWPGSGRGRMMLARDGQSSLQQLGAVVGARHAALQQQHAKGEPDKIPPPLPPKALHDGLKHRVGLLALALHRLQRDSALGGIGATALSEALALELAEQPIISESGSAAAGEAAAAAAAAAAAPAAAARGRGARAKQSNTGFALADGGSSDSGGGDDDGSPELDDLVARVKTRLFHPAGGWREHTSAAPSSDASGSGSSSSSSKEQIPAAVPALGYLVPDAVADAAPPLDNAAQQQSVPQQGDPNLIDLRDGRKGVDGRYSHQTCYVSADESELCVYQGTVCFAGNDPSLVVGEAPDVGPLNPVHDPSTDCIDYRHTEVSSWAYTSCRYDQTGRTTSRCMTRLGRTWTTPST